MNIGLVYALAVGLPPLMFVVLTHVEFRLLTAPVRARETAADALLDLTGFVAVGIAAMACVARKCSRSAQNPRLYR